MKKVKTKTQEVLSSLVVTEENTDNPSTEA